MEDCDEVDDSFPAPSIKRCIHGFVMFLLSLLCLLFYYLWALIPKQIIIATTGITYFPSKYWAISIPIFCLLFILIFGFFLYPGLILYLTPPLNDISTIYDCHHKKMTNKTSLIIKGIPPIYDLPMDYVCHNLYLN